MIQPELAKLAVTYNMHGGEPIGERTAQILDGDPDIFLLDLNRIAAAAGRRYMGKAGELGSLFPGNFESSNPDDLVAAWATQQLEKLPKDCNIADLHCTELPGADHAAVGRLVTPECLAIARLLGRNVVQWLPDYPFFGYFHNAVSIETSVSSNDVLEQKAQELAARLRPIAAMGSIGLNEYFRQYGTDDMTFYKRSAAIMLVKPDGTPNSKVLGILEELEEIDISERYAKVTITDRIARTLRIQPGTFTVNTWGHKNMSKPLSDNTYTSNGDLRRECFGDLLVEIKPPAELGPGLLYFELPGRST